MDNYKCPLQSQFNLHLGGISYKYSCIDKIKITESSNNLFSQIAVPLNGSTLSSSKRKIMDRASSTKLPLNGKSFKKKSPTMIPKQVDLLCNAEPVVVLKVLTPEEQALAQRSVSAFKARIPNSTEGWSTDDSNLEDRLSLRTLQKKSKSRYKDIDSDEDFDHFSNASNRKNKKSSRISRRQDSSSSDSSYEKGKSKKRRISDKDRRPRKFFEARNFSSSQKERIKKQKRYSSSYQESPYSEDDESRPPTPVEDLLPKNKVRKDKKPKKTYDHTNIEELMETATFKRFHNSIDTVLESAEEYNLAAEADEDGEDGEIATESDALIPKMLIAEMATEAAKLKSMEVTRNVPHGKLVKLITLLERNIKDGSKLLPNLNQDDEDEDERKIWKQLTMERISRSTDAALTVMYVMTSPGMPKQVYIEDVIERVIAFTKFHLQNNIYPEFDPVYKVDPESKDGYSGSIKLKRARAGAVKAKSIISLYNKLSNIVGLLAELLEIQILTDTTVLQISTLGVPPFFVENVSELQLGSLRLVTCIFSRYEKHRQLILEDIFASLARLPTSKRSLRNYRLNSEQNIQMVTALVLQLIQCVITLPKMEKLDPPSPQPISDKDKTKDKIKKKVDKDVLMVTSYENAMRTALNFLSVFLKKCGSKSEEDYRPLFENFIQDLLTTVNKPEWPASELILSLLGRLLVQNFSNKSIDMSLRVASIDYLGVVAARLRKDAISSQLDQESIDVIIEQVSSSEETKGRKSSSIEGIDKTQILQRALLDYLACNAQNDPALVFARQFYIAQWFRDITIEVEKTIKKPNTKKDKDRDKDRGEKEPDEKLERSRSHRERHRNKNKGKHKEKDSSEEDSEDEVDCTEDNKTREALENAERKKEFFLSMINPDTKLNIRQSQNRLDYDNASLVARYLASKRPFSQSFDIYLSQILRVLNETAVAVRTKAMKCLTSVVEADPGILARVDMQSGVHGRFLDQSTSVREAAVELVGKFVLIRPELTQQYYDMLIERILDTGISVRKRVIKILRDICIEQPEFKKITEICVKMIRRVNDEEGIKKLINEVFQSMWFTPNKEKDSKSLLRKVVNITDVVAACKDTGLEWFEQLLENLLKKEDDPSYKQVLKACKQIVNCLVENVLRLEENSAEAQGSQITSNQRLVACFSTLFLFSKIKPDLMVQHATTLQPYLNIKCSTHADYLVLHNVTRILELVVPLMDHPSETFLAQLEEDMMKLIIKHGMLVLQSCVSCLGAVVNTVTQNYNLVRDCFQKFFCVLTRLMLEHKQDPKNPTVVSNRPTLLRSLFTVGLLSKNFDFDSMEPIQTNVTIRDNIVTIRDKVFEVISYFLNHEDEEVRYKSLTGLGFFCIRHYDYMLGTKVKVLYNSILSNDNASVKLKCQVLKNIQLYLDEEETKMIKQDSEWAKLSKTQDLKEMGDVTSGMSSAVIQVYLKQILDSFFHSQVTVRLSALQVINLILRQGLVHPVQCVPYLISMGTDTEVAVRVKADQQIQEIDKKYAGFIHMKALQGVKMSYKLQQLIQHETKEPIRGFRCQDNPGGLNAFLYSLVRSNRQHRRALILNLLRLFDEQAKTPLTELLYIADNLSYFPYQTQDEALFIIHHIDLIVSVSGSNLLQSFREALVHVETNETEIKNEKTKNIYEEEDEDVDTLLEKIPEDATVLFECLEASQSCILLLILKQHLKDMYGFTDNKIHNYSPSESAKIYEKSLNRKPNVRFKPIAVIDHLKKEAPSTIKLTDKEKKKLIEQYLEFKQLMLSIDPDEEDDDSDIEILRLRNLRKQQNPGAEEEGADGEKGTGDGTEGDADKTPSKDNMSRSSHFTSKLSRSSIRRRERTRTTPKPKEKPKKKPKKKRRLNDSNDDDSDDDPDFLL